METEKTGDALLNRRAQILARGQLHDPPEKVVAIVAVGPLRAGRCDRRHQRLG